jgi:hypothetical protein
MQSSSGLAWVGVETFDYEPDASALELAWLPAQKE